MKWKRLREVAPSEADYALWFRGTRNNIAVLTGGMALFDCDAPATADLAGR